MSGRDRSRRALHRFGGDHRAASAVEFSLVAIPFIFMLIGSLQIGIYYMTQSSLDAGVVKTADALRNALRTGTSPVLPSAASLKTQVTQYSGGLVKNDTTLAVEMRQVTSLSGGSVAIADGTVDYGSTTSTLALRAQAKVVVFAPGFGALAYVRSSALLRRQGT